MNNSLADETLLWGPGEAPAAVSLTFDNLGEAADIERGLHPADKPVGEHYSVREVLPDILDLLDELGLAATFFVEGINARIYPESLKEISARGHEVGYHGWRHEYWPGMAPEEETRALSPGILLMEEIGVRPSGFRPPGGRLNRESIRLLEEAGLQYCSPAGERPGIIDGMAIIPFKWSVLDAFHYLPRFERLRANCTGSTAPLSSDALRGRLDAELERTVAAGGHLAVLFHPFLQDRKERMEALRSTLERVKELGDKGLLWCAPCREVARQVNQNPQHFGDPDLDHTEA